MGNGRDVQQFTRIGAREHGMRHAEILREALPSEFRGMLARQIVAVRCPASPHGVGVVWKSSAKFSGQIESIRWSDLRRNFREVSCAQSGFELRRSLRNHAVGKDADDFRAQFFILRSGREDFVSRALIERDGVEFVAADVPPTRQNGIGQNGWHQVGPNQRLDIFRSDKILFHLRQHVGQIGERSHQMRAAARGRSRAKEAGSLPERFLSAHHRLSGEIVRANEQRIVVQSLGARRFVIGVAETDERVAEERNQLSPRLVLIPLRKPWTSSTLARSVRISKSVW